MQLADTRRARRRPGDDAYQLGILVDTESFYDQPDILERDMMRPRLLRAFGWKVAFVLAKDWYEDPEETVAHLLRLIDGEDHAGEETADPEDDDAEQDARPGDPHPTR